MNEVIIKDIQMPFWSMVIFMVKWAFAAIPAIIIIAIFVAALAGMLAVGSPMQIVREVRATENESTARGLRHYQHYAKLYASNQDSEGST